MKKTPSINIWPAHTLTHRCVSTNSYRHTERDKMDGVVFTVNLTIAIWS